MAQKVLIADKLDDICERILREKGIEVVTKTGLSKEELIAEIKDYDGLVVRSATKATAEVINAADKLKVIGRAGAGVENIDRCAATKKGIAVLNTPYSNSIPVSELVFWGIGDLARSIGEYDQSTKKGEWKKGKLSGKREIYEKTIGIIGLGNIGREVAKKADGFGMNVLYYDPYINSKEKKRTKVSLEELFKESDYITLHVPTVAETKKMVTKDLLSLVKDDAVFINTSRAEIVEEGALEDILEAKPKMGAVVDVHYKEEEGEKPLAKFGERVVLTPHIGAGTKEAQRRGAEGVAEQIANFFEKGSAEHILNVVENVPEIYKPYKRLAEVVANLGCEIIETKPNKVEITCYGELGKHSKAFENSALMGVLKYKSDLFVNEINAPYLKEEQGIETKIREADNTKTYGNTITVDVMANNNDRISIRGTIDDGKVKVMRIGDYEGLSFFAEGKQLMAMYDESHGIVAAISHVFTRYEKSMGPTAWGWDEKRSRELLFVNLKNRTLDQQIISEITEEISNRRGKIIAEGDRTYTAIKEGINLYQLKQIDFGKVS